MKLNDFNGIQPRTFRFKNNKLHSIYIFPFRVIKIFKSNPNTVKQLKL